MFQSKDGKKFGSGFVAKRRDSEHDKLSKDVMGSSNKDSSMPMGESKEESRTNPQGEAKFSSKEATAPDNDVLANPEGVDAGAVAAEHQPATSVTTHHSKDKHVVVSRHPDGHMHMSQHKSHADAHAAAAQLSGPGQDENTNKPANEDSYGDGAPEKDGFLMPRLA
jgi:hypothetical protein